MKSKLMMIASLMIVAISAFATDKSTRSTTVRTWAIDGQITNIIAKGNIEVVLVHDDSQRVKIEGNEKAVNALHLQLEDNVLTVTGAKSSSKYKTLVYVPVHDLNLVTLKGGSNISSRGRLAIRKLRIRIEGVSAVNVKNIGDVIIDSDDHYQFNYEKLERSTIIVEKPKETVATR